MENITLSSLINTLQIASKAKKKYRILQKHLDSMPVGYPATFSGVELRLLQSMFTTEEAGAALLLGWRPQTFAEIMKKGVAAGYTEAKLRPLIESMERKGAIFGTGPAKNLRYSLHPLIMGMFEMQLKKLNAEMYLDLREYTLKRFAIEYYTTKVRQMRVIPVQKSVTPGMAIAAYDDIRELVDRTKDRIGVQGCICRAGKDEVGLHCGKTDRREVCLSFRDFYSQYARNGWNRTVTKKEAFSILDQNEKDGLVLMPSSQQDPLGVCGCCGCCCGILELVNMVPRPADFVESNYRAALKPETCKSCGKCATRCQMKAIGFEGKKAVSIDGKRCIGCGLCVTSCKSGSLKLVKKEKQFVPPGDHIAMMELIDKNRKSMPGKMGMMLRAMMGFRV